MLNRIKEREKKKFSLIVSWGDCYKSKQLPGLILFYTNIKYWSNYRSKDSQFYFNFINQVTLRKHKNAINLKKHPYCATSKLFHIFAPFHKNVQGPPKTLKFLNV